MLALRRLSLAGMLVAACAAPAEAAEHGDTSVREGSPFVAGDLLVASPQMGDPRFAGAVIYMVDHGPDGAMGVVVNRTLGRGPLSALLRGFGLETASGDGDVALHYGGPVEPGRGFVLHTPDYEGADTRVVGGRVALTSSPDILQAIAAGKGPRRRLLLLGYAGWGPGQLEDELARDAWLTAPVDEGLVFSDDLDEVWDAAMRRAGLAL